ncbi:MAG: UbiX family flavin prenyltransferase [Phycisphaeraceae bacterium]
MAKGDAHIATEPTNRRLVIAITGASGAIYAHRLVQLVVNAGIETHLVVSPLGQRLLHDELGLEGLTPSGLASLAGFEDERETPDNLILHNFRDVGATIASGSFRHDGMIVVPCSSNSLGAIASGVGQNLVHRAAHVTLKERLRLVLVHREMPLSLVDIRNMQAVTEAGAIVCPAQPGFYMLPETIQDLVDFVVGRVLDLVDVEHDLNIRWSEKVRRQGTRNRD